MLSKTEGLPFPSVMLGWEDDMNRSKKVRTKSDAVIEEFPFLRFIVTESELGKAIEEGSFSVRRLRERRLFITTEEQGEEVWAGYAPSSEYSHYAVRLPAGKQLWEAFPAPTRYPFTFVGRRLFKAVVEVFRRQAIVPGQFDCSIIVHKLPRQAGDRHSFFDCLRGIRKVAGWKPEPSTEQIND